LAVVVTGEEPNLKTKHLCSRRLVFVGKLEKLESCCKTEKAQTGINFVAAKKYKTGVTLQQTVLMEL